ncbi:hypothetical protein [Streptomyces globisporus]|uniref:hypothetical protein n=1 Tax=Streptomyces globisporus TaxID=1908 RepID=UPI0037C52CFA
MTTRSPELAALLVAAGLAGLVTEGGMPLSAGLLVLALAAVGALAIVLAYCLPSLVTALTTRRVVSAPAPTSPICDHNRVPVVSEPVSLPRLRE